MENANACNNTGKVITIVNQVSRKAKPPPQNITTDEHGKILESVKEAASGALAKIP